MKYGFGTQLQILDVCNGPPCAHDWLYILHVDVLAEKIELSERDSFIIYGSSTTSTRTMHPF